MKIQQNMIRICWYNLFTLSPKNITVNVYRKVKRLGFEAGGRNHKRTDLRFRRPQRQKDNSLNRKHFELSGCEGTDRSQLTGEHEIGKIGQFVASLKVITAVLIRVIVLRT